LMIAAMARRVGPKKKRRGSRFCLSENERRWHSEFLLEFGGNEKSDEILATKRRPL